MKLRAYLLPLLAISFAFAEPCEPSKKGPPQPGPGDVVFEVGTILPRFENVPRYVMGGGKFSTSDKISVKAPFVGIIDKVYAGEGDQVSIGDPLCLFDNEAFVLELEKKQAELKEAEMSLEHSRRMLELTGKGRSTDDTGGEEEGREQVFLDEDLPDKPIPPKVNEYGSDNANTQNVDWTSREKLDDAKIKRINKEIDQLEHQIKLLTVNASIGGIVKTRFVTDGSSVNKDAPLFEIVNLNPVSLSVEIPQEVGSYIDKLIKVIGFPVSAPELAVPGTVFYISPSVDPVKRTIEIRMHLPNEKLMMKEGQDGKAKVLTRKVDKVLVVPKKALVYEGNKTYIYVVFGSKANKTEVQIGEKIGAEEIEIEANIRVDDPIIISGHAGLEDGRFVKVIEEKQAIQPLPNPGT